MLKRLKEMRDARGWTQQQLAGASGVSQTFISELESCKKQPTVTVAIKLAQALGVELMELLQPKPTPETAMNPEPPCATPQIDNAYMASFHSIDTAVVNQADGLPKV